MFVIFTGSFLGAGARTVLGGASQDKEAEVVLLLPQALEDEEAVPPLVGGAPEAAPPLVGGAP